MLLLLSGVKHGRNDWNYNDRLVSADLLFLWAMVVSSKQADGKIREMMMGKETKNGIHEKD